MKFYQVPRSHGKSWAGSRLYQLLRGRDLEADHCAHCATRYRYLAHRMYASVSDGAAPDFYNAYFAMLHRSADVYDMMAS